MAADMQVREAERHTGSERQHAHTWRGKVGNQVAWDCDTRKEAFDHKCCLEGICGDVLVQSDLGSWILSVLPQRGRPHHPSTLMITRSSNSICLSSLSLHKHLPSLPAQGSSNLLLPFPSLGRLLTPLATKDYSSLSKKQQPLPICSL